MNTFRNLLTKSVQYAIFKSQTFSCFVGSNVGNPDYSLSGASGTGGAQFESSVGSALRKWIQTFQTNAISEPESSAINILAHCLGTRNLSDVYRSQHQILSPQQLEAVEKLCNQRLQKRPIQYIIGEWDFRGLTLKMRPPVFIPRPETEMLVDLVLADIDRHPGCHFLEPCCGSGAIALTILQERPLTKATVIDQSEAACQLTIENARKYNLVDRIEVIHSRLCQNQPFILENRKFDLVVSNPPYVPSADMEQLQPEIKLFEDLRALDGGDDGLDLIKLLLKISEAVLGVGGKLFLEVDPTHPALLGNLSPGLVLHRTHLDFSGEARFVEMMRR